MSQNKFSDDYREQVFFLWHELEHSLKALEEKLPSYEGVKPSILTVRAWIDTYNWRERSDALTAQLSVARENTYIEERAKVIKENLAVGDLLVQEGMDFLKNNKIEKAQDAIRALDLGVRIRQSLAGAPEWLEKIKNASDDKLIEDLNKLINKKDDDVIDGDIQE